MESNSMNNDRINALLGTLSAKTGVPAEQLRKSVENGNIDSLLKSMKTDDQKKLGAVLGNKAKMEKLMQSPQAKALYEKLTGKSPQ